MEKWIRVREVWARETWPELSQERMGDSYKAHVPSTITATSFMFIFKPNWTKIGVFVTTVCREDEKELTSIKLLFLEGKYFQQEVEGSLVPH